jgi:hypothetical protein
MGILDSAVISSYAPYSVILALRLEICLAYAYVSYSTYNSNVLHLNSLYSSFYCNSLLLVGAC